MKNDIWTRALIPAMLLLCLAACTITGDKPPSLYSYCRIGDADTVTIAGGLAYVGTYASGLEIVDIGNPARPKVIGSLAWADQTLDVAVSGGYAYLSCYHDGLRIVDVSDPTAPVLAGTYTLENTGDRGESVAVAGNFAYCVVASVEYAYLVVLDVSNPAQPSKVGRLGMYWPVGLALAGNYAFIGNGYGLSSVDISDPTNPQLVNTDEQYNIKDLDIEGNYLYLLGSGLTVLDITDPEQPVRTGSWYGGEYTQAQVKKHGNTVFIATGGFEVLMVNVTDPAHPASSGKCCMFEASRDIDAAGDYAYVADGDLQVVKLREEP